MNKTLVAFVAGIGIGILLAPRRGSETAKKLRDRLMELRNQGEDEADDLLAKGRKTFEKGKERVTDIM